MRYQHPIIAATLFLSFTALLRAQESPASSNNAADFLRLEYVDGKPTSLQTAVTSYHASAPGGVQVDLIGAVHIGEASYYQELNKLFDTYEVLLYELVAPEGTVIPRGGKREGTNPVAMLQDSAKNMLGLESQLELIDYTKTHFVRADMTPQQISDKMSERGDTALTLALSTVADVMRQQNLAAQTGERNALADLEDLSLVDIMSNPLKMKRVLAQQFADSGSLDKALGGPLNQLLIVDRNAEALRGLQKQIAQGKKRIGIFYGAAHLPDLEKHLLEDFGLKKVVATSVRDKPAKSQTTVELPTDSEQPASENPRWLVAWDLTTAKQPELSQPASLLLNLLKALDQ
ncbi:MAG: hypothetical protein R3C53_24220 [Pirellulaceae bacterium]